MKVVYRSKAGLDKSKEPLDALKKVDATDSFDALGSYTGTPDYGLVPQQDADDL